MLTKREKELFEFIKEQIATTGVAPSMNEISVKLGTRGRGQIQSMLVHLTEKGFIRRLPYRARAIEIVGQGKTDEIDRLKAEHDRRVTELLQANEREVERRRAAEAEVRRLLAERAA